MAMAAAAMGRVLWRRNDDDGDNIDAPLSPLFPSPSFHSNRMEERRCMREEDDHNSCQAISSSDHGGGLKAKYRSREQLWHQFFADPSQWRDNRLTKRNPKQPDFKHNRTLEALWIDSWWNPSWVRKRIATLDSLGHIWLGNPCSNDGEDLRVQKLCKEGRVKDAIYLVESMVQQTPIEEAPKGAYISLLKECAKRKMLREGKRVHVLIVQSKYHSDMFMANNLIDMYSKCGSPSDARLVFDAMPRHNVFSWTGIISAYADSTKCEEAINLYKRMQNSRIAPDIVVFVVVLKACARVAALETGKQIHSLILEKGIHLDRILQNSLVDMYAKCGCLDDARDLFNNMTERDVISWNAMIGGYAQNGIGREAIALYEQMKQKGMEPDKITFVCVLKACANIGALEQAKQIHSLIQEKGFHLDMIVQSTLVDMYSKCGCLEDARELFNKMSKRDVVSWNAMIGGYVENGLWMEALGLYEQMRQEGMQPSRVTFFSVLKACANIGALEQGKEIHSLILENGVHLDMILQSSLVDMYAKCGCLKDARELFNNMNEWDVVSCNALFTGYAQSGLGMEAIALFEQMKQEGIQPNDVTYLSVLAACNHSGLVKEGLHVFEFMCKYSDVLPNLEHYACMVDLLGRAGWLAEAKDLIVKMPIQPDSVVWMSLLCAARNAGNAEIGERAFEYIVNLEPENASPYLLLIDIYARVGWMGKAAEMRKEMEKGCKSCLAIA